METRYQGVCLREVGGGGGGVGEVGVAMVCVWVRNKKRVFVGEREGEQGVRGRRRGEKRRGGGPRATSISP